MSFCGFPGVNLVVLQIHFGRNLGVPRLIFRELWSHFGSILRVTFVILTLYFGVHSGDILGSLQRFQGYFGSTLEVTDFEL